MIMTLAFLCLVPSNEKVEVVYDKTCAGVGVGGRRRKRREKRREGGRGKEEKVLTLVINSRTSSKPFILKSRPRLPRASHDHQCFAQGVPTHRERKDSARCEHFKNK